MKEGNNEELDEVEEKLSLEYAKYHDNVGKKWIVALVGLILGSVIGYFSIPSIYGLSRSSYDRGGIEKLADQLMGTVRVEDALTHEVAIVAYDFNAHEPRVFSKLAAKLDPKKFNVELSDAS